MDDSNIKDTGGIKKFLKGASGIRISVALREEKYRWITTVLRRFSYFKLRKKEKTTVKKYMIYMTGFSDAQITRLIAEERNYGGIGLRAGSRHCFARTYTKADIELLAETDNLHERLSGPATKRLFQRAYEVCGDSLLCLRPSGTSAGLAEGARGGDCDNTQSRVFAASSGRKGFGGRQAKTLGLNSRYLCVARVKTSPLASIPAIFRWSRDFSPRTARSAARRVRKYRFGGMARQP